MADQRGDSHKLEERMLAAYEYILEGGTRQEIVSRLAHRFNISIRTGHNDYTRAMELIKSEQILTRDDLLSQMQACRLSLVRRAIKKGQLMVASQTLRDMGAVIGETSEVTTAEQINLNISIEPQQSDK